MPVAQVLFFLTMSKPHQLYSLKAGAKYNNQEARPKPSAMWRNFLPKTEPV
jgi:deoxycytidine triphosphate deaminase